MGFIPKPYFIAIPVEQWADLTYPGVTPGKYKISNYGNVFNINRNRFVSKGVSIWGYLTCALSSPGRPRNTFLYYIHRLVAWDWVPKNRDFNLQVNHIDGFKLNNSHLNLEWVTNAENVRHAYANGLIENQRGEAHSKLKEEEVRMICEMLEDPKVMYDDILEKLNNKITKTALKQIASGQRWGHITCQYDIKPRLRFGNCNGRSNLTETDVHCICAMLQNPDVSYEYIEEKFDGKISVDGIKHIAYGHVWKHISDQYNIPPRSISLKAPVGNNSSHHTLTEEEVHIICRMLEDPEIEYDDIMKAVNNKVTMSAIKKITDGINWKHISKNYDFSKRKQPNIKM